MGLSQEGKDQGRGHPWKASADLIESSRKRYAWVSPISRWETFSSSSALRGPGAVFPCYAIPMGGIIHKMLPLSKTRRSGTRPYGTGVPIPVMMLENTLPMAGPNRARTEIMMIAQTGKRTHTPSRTKSTIVGSLRLLDDGVDWGLLIALSPFMLGKMAVNRSRLVAHRLYSLHEVSASIGFSHPNSGANQSGSASGYILHQFPPFCQSPSP